MNAEHIINMIPASWQALLRDEFGKPYWQQLAQFLTVEISAGKEIYPPQADWFHALIATPPEAVRVVILGQDPYHGPGQAHGLSFSVQPGIAIPRSLVNIYKEIRRDLGGEMPPHGHLQRWAEQGVLLLNTVLTVERGKAGAHRGHGWEHLTDAIIGKLAQQQNHIVFMLWGNAAQAKTVLIPSAQHCILASPHPSPLSASRGFIGNGHFSKANSYLEKHGRGKIDWHIK